MRRIEIYKNVKIKIQRKRINCTRGEMYEDEVSRARRTRRRKRLNRKAVYHRPDRKVAQTELSSWGISFSKFD